MQLLRHFLWDLRVSEIAAEHGEQWHEPNYQVFLIANCMIQPPEVIVSQVWKM